MVSIKLNGREKNKTKNIGLLCASSAYKIMWRDDFVGDKIKIH